jgi:hypothetical protein
MPSLFPDKRPWFPVKRFGYGAGLPIARQGWFLVLAYVAVMIALGFVADGAGGLTLAGVVVLMLAVTAIFVLIVKARTNGAWRWRWGEDA